MYFEVMTTMIYRCIDNLFPVVGGAGGGYVMINYLKVNLLWMTWQQYAEAILMIILAGLIGGFVGWLVKRWLDKLFPKKNRRLK